MSFASSDMPISGRKWSRSQAGHRTNSLGSAKVDCHTCLHLGARCDRQRPRCGTCINSQRECGGFVLDLVWKDHGASAEARQPRVNKARYPGLSTEEPHNRYENEKVFRFVAGRQNRKRKRRGQAESTRQSIPPVNTESSAPTDCFVFSITNLSPAKTSETDLNSAVTVNLGDHMDLASLETTNCPSDLLPADWNALNTQQGAIFDDDVFPPHVEMSVTASQPLNGQCPLYPVVQFLDQPQRFAPILGLYNQEFCVLPLTMDCLINPFRVSPKQCASSDFLTHAMLAISTHHMSKRENSAILKAKVHDHQSTAIRLFSEALIHSNPMKLLDTLLLLVNFEALQSASATWAVHLQGAQKILDRMGGAEVCRRSPRVRAQQAILVWWDVTIAFISRREPILPEYYLQALMEYDLDQTDGWTFFALNGCPAYLAMAMRRLAKLASIYEKAAKLEWTTFNTAPVDLIVDAIMQWKNNDDVTADEAGASAEDTDKRLNRFHCIEAWRYAVLIYTRRVFTQKQDASGLRSISHLSRIILDHVRCIPESEIVQKQTLLPVFLAAAETGDEAVRCFVRHYCRHWTMTTGYFMFDTVATLLETIWADWDYTTRNVYWWGTKVGSWESTSGSGEQFELSELLLG